MESSGFSMYNNITSTTNSEFTSSFPIWIPFNSFSCLIAMARNANTVLNKRDEGRHLCLFPDLRRNAFSFSPLSTIYPWACHIWYLLCWGIFPLHPLLKIFNHKWMLNYVKCFFLHLLRLSFWFLFFISLMWYIMLIDLLMLNYPCIPRINWINHGVWSF